MAPYSSPAFGRGTAMPRHPTLSGKGVTFTTADGRGTGSRGLGKAKLGAKRHRKLLKDNILGVTKGDIRRLARRGGVKRISGTIYSDIRDTLRTHLGVILKDIAAICDHSGRKTVVVSDVIFALRRIGRPIYGFDVTGTERSR